MGSADPLIVDRITTGVDVTADNTTHHPTVTTNSQRGSLAVEKCFTAALAPLRPRRPRPFIDAVAGQ